MIIIVERSAAVINYQQKVGAQVRSVSRPKSGTMVYLRLKRMFDAVAAFVLLAVLCLPMLIIALAVKIDSEGPVIFRQRRVGAGGTEFEIFKFRSMSCSAPSQTATRELDDPYRYITRVGRFLRKTSLDEIPQLFNILRGDMSVIGPRPLVVSEEDVHSLRTACGVYDAVSPGITGWAQVNGRDDVPIEEKVAFDKFYADNVSFGLDARILFRTIAVVLRCDGYREGRR